MRTIPQTVTHIANELHLPVDRLMAHSLQAYLRQEIRGTQLDIHDFQDRYQVTDSTSLRTQIEQGNIYSHPAWEHSIEWEHLEKHLVRVKRLLGEVRHVP